MESGKEKEMKTPTLKELNKEFDKEFGAVEVTFGPHVIAQSSLGPIKTFYNKKILELLEYLEIKERAWGSNGEIHEDQSVSKTLYHKQLKVLGFNQAVSKLNKRIKKVKG